jgi:hypothetical protein
MPSWQRGLVVHNRGMNGQPKSDHPMRASRYFIEGEDIALEGGCMSDCRYIQGSIAFAEWMAGFQEGCIEESVPIAAKNPYYGRKRILIPSIFNRGVTRG